MSRLRRDRKALRWGRYTRRGEKLSGVGNTRGTPAEWQAVGWLINRRMKATKDDVRAAQQMRRIIAWFYPM